MLIWGAGAALFGWSRSRLFVSAPIPALNILFLRDPTGNYEYKYEYDYDYDHDYDYRYD